MKFVLRGEELDFSSPFVMGILNVTPDSFSDGGELFDRRGVIVEVALARAKQMIQDGALIIDVGGESSRPGSVSVSVEEELDRVIPVVKELLKLKVFVSVDTTKPEVARKCLDLGVHIINDISGFQNEEMVEVCSLFKKEGIGCVVMHMLGTPKTMQLDVHYNNVVEEVFSFLQKRVSVLRSHGLNQIMVDPGIGFGKEVDHNLLLIKHVSRFCSLGPVLIGASRKSVIGKVTGDIVDERLGGSVALHVASVLNGVNVIRVHDVKEHIQALQMIHALENVD